MFGVNLGNLVVFLKGNATQYTKTLKMAEKQLVTTATKFKKMGRLMSTYITVPLVAIGAFSLKTFADFDQAMTSSLAIMGDVSAELRQEMEDTARVISTTSVTSAKALASAYFFLASAGLDAAQSIAALPVVEKFAVAGAFSMTQATDLLTDAMSALGLATKDAVENQKNMTRVSDVLVGANTLANASVEQFSSALTNKAGAALRLLGKDVEEGVAVLAVFADQGLKGVAAGEALSMMSRDLQKAFVKNTSVWEKMGLTVFDGQGKMLKYSNVIGQLTQKFSQLSDRQKAQTAIDLGFQDRSFNSIKLLLGNARAMASYENRIRRLAAITRETANKQLKSFTNQLKITWNIVKDMAISIGSILAPSVLKLNGFIRKGARWWRGLNIETKKAIVFYASLAAAIGPVIVMLGVVLTFMSAVVAAISFIATTIGSIIGAVGVAGLAGIIAGVLTAVTAIVVGVLLVAKAVQKVVNNIWGPGAITGAFMKALEAAKLWASNTIRFLSNLSENFKIFMDWLSVNWEAVVQDMISLFVTLVINMGHNIKVLTNTGARLFTLWSSAIGNIFKETFLITFVNWAIKGLVKVLGLFDRFKKAIQSGLIDALIGSGDSTALADLGVALVGDMMAGLTPGSILEDSSKILKEQVGQLRTPTEGFKSSIQEGPKFNLGRGPEGLEELAKKMRARGANERQIRQAIIQQGKVLAFAKATQEFAKSKGLVDFQTITKQMRARGANERQIRGAAVTQFRAKTRQEDAGFIAKQEARAEAQKVAAEKTNELLTKINTNIMRQDNVARAT